METALSYAEAGGRFLLNLLILPFDEYYVCVAISLAVLWRRGGVSPARCVLGLSW